MGMKTNWRDKKVLIMGLGLHGGGLAATKYFLKRGAKVTVTDLRSAEVLKPTLRKLGNAKISYTLGRHDQADFAAADLVIQNPGVPNNSPFLKIARQHGAQIENEAGIFFSQVKTPTIAITGTKGKSTTTTLVWKIVRAVYPKALVAGNIRTNAMLEIIDRLPAKTPVVLELSSWQLEGLVTHRQSPSAALITNVLPDHLNRYRSFAHYRSTKGIIFKYQKKSDLVVLNLDNPSTKLLGQRSGRRVVWFSKSPFPRSEHRGAFVKDGSIRFGTTRRSQLVVPISEIRLLGEHNLDNVLGAVALTAEWGIPIATIRKVVRSFRGIADRLEPISTVKGVRYINDTTATAPVATLAALQAIAPLGNVILIAGGQNKDLEYADLVREIQKKVTAVVMLPGTASDLMSRSLPKSLIHHVSTMSEAVRVAAKLARAGDSVLLSPAAASFNLFTNEFDRASQFRQAVKRLPTR